MPDPQSPHRQPGLSILKALVITTLAGLAITLGAPKIADMVIKSREARIRANLGELRAGINLYYSSQKGVYPATLSSIFRMMPSSTSSGEAPA